MPDLAELKQKGLYRQRSSMVEARVFCDNDYLALAKDRRVIEAFKQGADQYGVGGVASQLVAGYLPIHQKLEKEFAEFLQRDAALLFTTGYMANCGVINALTSRHDTVYADKLIHASLIDAIQLSGVKLKRYKHLNYQQLDEMLAQHRVGNKFVLTDSVFSMRGELADVTKCAAIAERHRAQLIVDDAHGLGIIAAAGSAEFFNLSQQQLPVLICPLAKAFGTMGAVVAGSKRCIERLIQFARSYIYTTAIPPAFAAAALTALHIVKSESWRREKLYELINYFKQSIAGQIPLIDSDTPIQCVLTPKAEQFSEYLAQCGFYVKAIRPPTVPKQDTCLRITITLNHTKAAINELSIALRKWYDKTS